MSDETIAAGDEHHDVVDHDVHDEHHSGHPSDKTYVIIALVLAVITAIETLTYFESAIEFGPFLLPVLLIAMAAKFYLVAAYFMHLKFDDKTLRQVFIFGVVLAILVYFAFLLTFSVFTNTSFP